MENSLQIYCKNTESLKEVAFGESLLNIYNRISFKLPFPALCAKVNNKTEDMAYRVYNPKDVEFVDISNPSGMRAYVRSLCFVLYKAVNDLMPGARLRIEHSVSNGYFCGLNNRQEVNADVILRIKKRMQEIVEADIPFERIECRTEEAIGLFKKYERKDKVDLLETLDAPYTVYYRLDNVIDYYYSCLVPSTRYLSLFNLIKYDGGLLLVIPSLANPSQLCPVISQDKMLDVFKEYTHFNYIAGLSNVGNLNQAVIKRRATDLIKVTEALHEKKIAGIADQIASLYEEGRAKVILISGPSSSGKTTFSKRLSIQLMTNLLHPVTISLDNYFIDREKTPRDEFGEYDYESVYTIDLELFNQDLNKLLKGEEVRMPTYNFESGKKVYRGNKLKIHPSTVLILEGIHALNPVLTTQINDAIKFKIYVSALTSISIDDHNWIPTTDNRLLRRIVRDYKYRGNTAQNTIARWQSVRRGEDRWIFPFQETADAMFNSSLLFELAVMKRHAEPVLRAVPRNSAEYGEANRLLKFLEFFLPINEHEIPPTSLLREFLGGSSFKY